MDLKTEILRNIDEEIFYCRYENALRISKKAFKEYNDNCFLNRILNIHLKKGDYKSAVSMLKKMMKTKPNDPYLIEQTAYCFLRLNNYKNALKYYKILLDLSPCSSKYNFNAACMYDFMEDYKNALKYYKYAVDADIRNISARNNYAVICCKLNQYDTAIKIFNDIMRVAPNHPEAYHHMGIIYRDYLNDMEMALLCLKKAYRLDKTSVLNPYQTAITYKVINDIPKALEYAKKAAEINPCYKPAADLLKELSGI